ncbi:MAG: AAA family ATPase [Candidatus Gracilibacteria bacterium]|nr:AAA family ATPase [Candidatus Gracilibacteria bacterium]MDQ7023390.1 AAA family ATPase [Candidatus Gracilibacteria bacterium]
MLNRKIIDELIIWKNSKYRKPLIVKGARQVGKSFAIKYFGENNFRKIHIINFQSNKKVHSIFEGDINPNEIITKLEYILDENIDIKNDLIFFDEIQECPKAINSFKFFCEKKKELAIIGAGSYLGLIKNGESFPVGKVDFLSMFPLNFEEFLEAIKNKLFNFYKKIDINNLKKIDDLIHKELLKYLNLYFFIGGMPEIVNLYKEGLNNNNNSNELLNNIRKTQLNLLESYKADFTKYSGIINSSHILSVYDSVSKQLSLTYNEEVNKFKFVGVIPNKKGFSSIDGPLTWLSESRLVIKSFISNKANNPLKSHTKENTFKLFFHDIGLLNASLETPISEIILNDLSNYKGYIVENFIAQELFNIFDKDLISWTEGISEIEFLINIGGDIIPIEVKSSEKYRKAKSLDSFIKRYSPKIAYKFTMQNYSKNEDRGYSTLPMYLVGKIKKTKI